MIAAEMVDPRRRMAIDAEPSIPGGHYLFFQMRM